MKLYMSFNSPYVRLVRILLREIDAASKVEEIDINPREAGARYWPTNPIALIPALELPNGTVLTESDLICRHLDDTLAGGRIYAPVRNNAHRAATLGIAQGILYRGLNARNDQLRPGGPDSEPFIKGQLDAAARGAEALEKVAMDHVGQVDIVDITVGCAVNWFNFRHAQLEILKNRPKLTAWVAQLDAMPSFSTTQPG